MPTNHFFDKKGPFPLNEIIQAIGYGEDLPSKTNVEEVIIDKAVVLGQNEPIFVYSKNKNKIDKPSAA